MLYTSAHLRQLLPPLKPDQALWVAFSGGLDSCVLLHSLRDLDLENRIAAIHVNHQLSPHAGDWQQHCADFCAQLNIPFYSERVEVQRCGRGLEDAARTERYRVFARYLNPGDLLLTAHHSDDQAETLLLRLLRGSGPRGLAAMAPVRPFGAAWIWRPLLSIARTQLHAYAQTHQLHWVEDPSNQDTHYDRNYLRQGILPLLRQRWPQLNRHLGQTAQLCAEADLLLEEMAAEDLPRMGVQSERLGESLSLLNLNSLSLARRHNLVRFWLRQHQLPGPEQAHLQEIDQQLFGGRPDTEAQVSWGDVSLRRFQNRLYLLSTKRCNEPVPRENTLLPVDLSIQAKTMEVHLSTGGTLQLRYEAQSSAPGNLRADLPPLGLSWRCGGERCRPYNRSHSQTLKKLLQEYRLEPWWRDQLPLLTVNGEIAAAGDLWVCKGYEAALGTPGFRLHWCPGVPL